ncbi:hypothetical protein NDN13_05385 [Acinetobacter sp. C32I]|uniref:NACHT domain-containing protein n=1 Tax=Acinetobacter sp. C32I TaxID=2950074 RepID=UPI002036730F|nr:hypothetical protein [Acinetobacter sp. C32I]USA54627.1 hypothetical protein NDN13_05385 [Acinetobacter sp. C32I]
MLNRNEIIDIYKSYGFTFERSSEYSNILIFTIQSGHYHNADIIDLDYPNNNSAYESAFKDYSTSGYACIKRKFTSIESVKNGLFEGFFSVENTKNHLNKEYETHVNQIIRSFPDNSEYKYINSTYEINNKKGELNPITEITSRLNDKRPILFIIEAAAGFGKTCTAYEILDHIVKKEKNMVPLFSELSRNRQAKIFHYVLLDEIDRSFPNLKSQLVKDQILNGKVPVILDGFDELLHNPNKHDYSNSSTYNTEPMLETISDLLNESAKIILTSRRTALFDGDDFAEWVEEHKVSFDIYRIKINEPTITDWLPPERFQKLSRTNYPILKLNNPVLLSFLRFISDEDYCSCIENPELIIEKYFLSMLERERKRQALQLLPAEQSLILKSIAQYFIVNNFTTEEKEFLHLHIEENFEPLLENARKYYQTEDRPTTNELINKLTSHALLDRSGVGEEKIGFVNDFVLGHYVVPNINDTAEWLGDKIFIEPAVTATTPTSEDKRRKLWESLDTYFYVEDNDLNLKVNTSVKLRSGIFFNLTDQLLDRLNFQNITIGSDNYRVENFTFYNCMFSNINFNLDNFKDVAFVQCKFFDCYYNGYSSSLIEMGCTGQNDNFFDFISSLNKENELSDITVNENNFSDIELSILDKFWPKGSSSIHKHRHHNAICGHSKYNLTDLFMSIKNLKKRKVLLTPDKEDFYELNFEFLSQIKAALGKND